MNIIFFDIDGTLDDDEGVIPASTVQAVRRTGERGALRVINTGRPLRHIAPKVRALGFDGYICSCGQLISLGGKVTKRHSLTEEQSRYIIALAEKYRVDCYFESEDGCLFSFTHPMNALIKYQLKDFTERGLPLFFGFDCPGFIVDKFCFWTYGDSDERAFVNAISEYYNVIVRGEGVFEAVLKGFSKASGINEFLSLSGFTGAETYAIGDSTNDIPMLEAVDHAIVMGGAPESVKRIAEYVTDTLENDGLYKALAHYELI